MIFSVTREIGIDAGHRIMTHGSKCRHLHGHRYQIEATAEARHLHDQGVQTGMVIDFSFLKDEMLAEIDSPCDHGFIACCDDTDLLALFAPADAEPDIWLTALRHEARALGYASPVRCRLDTKLYVIPGQPTAETLARHWFERLAPRVTARSDGLATLTAITVRETPNCRAEYRPRG
ncbi:MAG: 6-carboxytetrahydropterin synthase [Rhodospirillaceae bacterium]